MQALVILLILSLLVVVQSAEAANVTVSTTVTISVAQEKATVDNYNNNGGSSSGNAKTATESTTEKQQETIPTETTEETFEKQQETTSETTQTNQQSTRISSTGSTSSIGFIQTSSRNGIEIPSLQQGGELQYLTANRIELPEFEPNPISVVIKPEVIAPLVASVGVGVVSAFPIKPFGFSAASAKTFRVAVMYRKSMLFSKTQTVFALAFLSLAFASISNFMNLEIISLVLLPAFFGLVIYHNVLWYVRYSYCRVDTLSRQVLVILPVLGLLGYLSMVFTEAISFDILQTIAVVGLLIVVPSTVFTALSFRGSRLEAKWILITVGLTAVMSGIILSVGFMIGQLTLGDWLVLAGCGLVVWGQWNLSTKYSTE